MKLKNKRLENKKRELRQREDSEESEFEENLLTSKTVQRNQMNITIEQKRRKSKELHFQVICMMTSFYLSMVFSNWIVLYNQSNTMIDINDNSSLWIRFIATFIAHIYIFVSIIMDLAEPKRFT